MEFTDEERNRNRMKKILVAGDSMLDVYHFGQVNRISPEAPVPVFLEEGRMKYVPGGAANVAVNIAAIGINVILCSVIGTDDNGRIFLDLIGNNHIDTKLIRQMRGKPTATKLRYIGPGNQQILRVDNEDIADIHKEDITDFFCAIKNDIEQVGLIVLSDYKKGFLTDEITFDLIKLGNDHNIPILVDVKDKNFKKYGQATLLKPNRKELHLLTGMDVGSKEDVIEASMYLCMETPCKYVLATLGAEGMLLADKNGLIKDIESTASEVFDVTGAGDTSVAYLAAEMLNGSTVADAMIISNYAAGIQVSKVGTSVVYPYEVSEKMNKEKVRRNWKKSDLSVEERITEIKNRKENGERIVFTNGCFDILHSGHVIYLKEARNMGDLLVVGLNSDESVKRLKGEQRPVNTLTDREMMLNALSFVDYVVPFEEDTPINLINSIVPDILVKGGDYIIEQIVGYDTVMQHGGCVKTIPFVKGHSTSEIIRKIEDF